MGRGVVEWASERGLPAENFHPTEPGLHMEIIDTRTFEVWQTMACVTREEFEALEPHESFRKVGMGALAADCSFFRRSPGAQADGAMKSFEHGGHRFSLCARPVGAPSFPAGPEGPRLMSVEKHHGIIYEAGREIPYLRSPKGEIFIHVVGSGLKLEELVLPEGWSSAVFKTPTECIVDLPCPTSALFFSGQGSGMDEMMESFQGPITRLGSLEE